ncbi:MAG: hypothetical protein ACKV2V_20770 [Blastocatellia bacterium]
MKTYRSFLTRCWVIEETAGIPRYVFEVEHIHGGERLKTSDPDEVRDWMFRQLLARDPPAPETESETEVTPVDPDTEH